MGDDLDDLTDEFRGFRPGQPCGRAARAEPKSASNSVPTWKKVFKVFAYLIDQLTRELNVKPLGSTPSQVLDYDAAKRELEAYAVEIIDGMKRATPGHETSAKDAEGRIKNRRRTSISISLTCIYDAAAPGAAPRARAAPPSRSGSPGRRAGSLSMRRACAVVHA